MDITKITMSIYPNEKRQSGVTTKGHPFFAQLDTPLGSLKGMSVDNWLTLNSTLQADPKTKDGVFAAKVKGCTEALLECNAKWYKDKGVVRKDQAEPAHSF